MGFQITLDEHQCKPDRNYQH
uniref:Uncharacterized protein n=1 Tax=Anguilla anguilla TaxID=7936 RepID=A0A0E9RDF7_ANGAN